MLPQTLIKAIRYCTSWPGAFFKQSNAIEADANSLPSQLLNTCVNHQEEEKNKKEGRHSFITINNPGYNPGMFSVFLTVLGALHLCEENKYPGLKVQLEKGAYYDPEKGNNWWEYFFEPLKVTSGQSTKKKCFSDEELSKIGHWTLKNINKHRGRQLIDRYIRVKPFIQAKIDTFAEMNFKNAFTVGIHYRGTDQLNKNRQYIPSYEEVAARVEQTITARKQNLCPTQSHQNPCKVFVATDEQPFLDYLKEKLPYPITHSDSLRSSNGLPVHLHYYSSNYQKGEDALIDCLLLSRCNALIRPASNLSICSEWFNPTIPVVVL